MRPITRQILVLALSFTAFMPRALAAPDDLLESRVKAAFVFNFLRFTEWPQTAFASPQAPLVVGVVGSGNILSEIVEAMKGKFLGGHPIVVDNFAPGAVGRCHILFVSGAAGPAAESVANVAGSPVLTVGDGGDFSSAGGMIRLFVEDKKERFEINTDAADRAHLQISAKLLKLAKVVNK